MSVKKSIKFHMINTKHESQPSNEHHHVKRFPQNCFISQLEKIQNLKNFVFIYGNTFNRQSHVKNNLYHKYIKGYVQFHNKTKTTDTTRQLTKEFKEQMHGPKQMEDH